YPLVVQKYHQIIKTKRRPSEFFKKFEWSSLQIETYVTASFLSLVLPLHYVKSIATIFLK
ncbi:hypothetical protein, partial [Ligilactobacillus murinus]|uniref:hypothetical protein n=1 Tax=Ligilactobacillus murinus TaxID=1622 RepID=UPI0031DB88AF